MDALCSCYEAAYLCYRDCDKLPEDFEAKCLRNCDPSICTPQLSLYAKGSASAAGISTAAVLVAASLVAVLVGG